MRFLVIVKATERSEAGELPSSDVLEEMGRFNAALARDGMLLSGEGLWASRHGARLQFDGGSPRRMNGPFGPASELVAGYWTVEAPSFEAAVERFTAAPFREGEVIEIRRILEAEDFGEAFGSEQREEEARLRESTANR